VRPRVCFLPIVCRDSFTKLVDGSRDVSTKDLSSVEYLTFLWWKIRNRPRTVIRPRASWAQLLLALGIRNTSEMRYKFEDADLIPSSFDAPVQRVKLFDLGYIALVLGFTTVKIDLPERNFEATSPFATIKTLNLPETGKILRFEGDIFAIQKNVSKGDARILVLTSSLIVAKLSFGPDFLMSGYMIPLQLLKQATTESWEEEKFDTELRASVLSTVSQNEFSAGQIGAEAFLFRDLRDNSLRSEPRRAIDVFRGDVSICSSLCCSNQKI
jgi:hypothetical protein